MTVAETERLCQLELDVAAEHKNREDVSTMQERLLTKY
jgi:phosphoribosylformylglycinamidine (FGAM) synthase PurS component